MRATLQARSAGLGTWPTFGPKISSHTDFKRALLSFSLSRLKNIQPTGHLLARTPNPRPEQSSDRGADKRRALSDFWKSLRSDAEFAGHHYRTQMVTGTFRGDRRPCNDSSKQTSIVGSAQRGAEQLRRKADYRPAGRLLCHLAICVEVARAGGVCGPHYKPVPRAWGRGPRLAPSSPLTLT